MQHEFDRIHNKLDKIETKLDGHLDRIAVSETKITNIQGFITIGVVTIIIPAVLATFGYLTLTLIETLK